MQLKCFVADEYDGDELFLKYRGKRIWPVDRKFERGSTEKPMPLNIEVGDVGKDEWVVIQLWDSDFLSSDLLGEFVFMADQPGGPYRTDLKNCKGRARYTLEFQISPNSAQG